MPNPLRRLFSLLGDATGLAAIVGLFWLFLILTP